MNTIPKPRTLSHEHPDSIDDARQVYMDSDHDEFGTVIEKCLNPDNPTGQCVYTAKDHFTRCKYCRAPSWLP